MAHPGGRPTSLTPIVQATIIKALRDDLLSRHAACGRARVSYQSMLNWLERGENGEQPYAEFFDAVKEAEADAECATLQRLQANQKCWQREAWWLERRFPERWALRTKHEVTGPGGGPVQHEHAGRLVLTGEAALAVVAFHEDTNAEMDGVHSAPADAETGSVPEPDAS